MTALLLWNPSLREALLQSFEPGAVSDEVLLKVGIEPRLLGVADARVPATAYARLWRLLARRMDDEFFGMDPRQLKSGSLEFLCRCGMAQPTLAAGLTSGLGFLSFMLERMPAQLVHQQSLAEIVLFERPGPASRLHRFHLLDDCTWLHEKVDREFPGYLKPKGVPFSHPGIEFMLRCSVISIVQRFRAAIEHEIKVHGAPMHIEGFPSGCCGIISELMGDYLNSLEIGEFHYVSSMLDGASHAWVEVDGLVIDITADQFPGRPGIYVGKL